MGYTVYWEFLDWHGEWKRTWPQLITDAKLIIEAADVLACGPTPEEFPRHFWSVSIHEDIDFYPPICEVEDGIWLNGLAEDGHEPFVLRRSHRNHSCKTLFKPYNTIVGCILLRACQLQPDLTSVCCDGNWEESWTDIRELYSELWPDQEIIRPPDLEGMDEKPSDPRHPRSWLNKTSKYDIITTRDTVTIDSPRQDGQRSSSAPLELELKQAANISTWLTHCGTDHQHKSCQPPLFRWSALPGVHFRLVDVKRRCIVQAPLTPAFAALSYVWGGIKQPMLTSATEIVLTREGGLDQTSVRLPDTINDAVALCKSIGLEYLWVDALCIKQDSTRDLKLQMRRMRAIYAGAMVTIVNATGDDAEARLVSCSKETPNPRLLSVQELADVLSKSAWSSRGWTYQELVLSHRVVFCTSAGVYLVCQRNARNIDGQSLRFSHGFLNPSLLMCKPPSMSVSTQNHQLHSFLRAVERYSQRTLSYQKDALNAFQGIIQGYGSIMDQNENAFYYGLPTCAFDQVFCFRTSSHNPPTRRRDFPSWSWLGWSEPVRFDHELIDKVRTWNMIHPPILKDSIRSWPNSIHWETAGLKNLWRPIEHNPFRRNGNEYGEWGFPSAIDSFLNEPALRVAVSIADLRISAEATRMNGDQGHYNIYPVKCTQTPPPEASPKMVSVRELRHRAIPKAYIPTEEEKRAPLIPAERQTMIADAAHHAEDFHDSHQRCEAHMPLGGIWLDQAWRDLRGKNCIMGFVALCGKKKKKAGWVITRLMLTERVAKKDLVWARERVHTLECEIGKETWMRAGAVVLDLRLV